MVAFGERLGIEAAIGVAQGGAIAPRRIADLLLQAGRHVVDGIADGRRCVRIGLLELGAHRSGRGFEEFEKILAGQIVAPASASVSFRSRWARWVSLP